MAEKKPPDGSSEDDAYVLEDTGDSIEDIEHEMEVVAQEADVTLTRRGSSPGTTPVPSSAEDAEELRKVQDRYLRTLADFENYRKRAEREKDEFRRFALNNLIRDLLPVLDNFDRALEHAEGGDDFHKGVLMIYKQLWDVLEKAGIKPIEEVGVRFDPNIHEAVIGEEDPTVPANTVIALLQKGYFLHDRLLRPALVKVAVGGPEHRDDIQ
jgi:molecular chaperone GrpE